MTNRKRPGRLPVNVHEALAAIATTGKGRCWHCDGKLPPAERAMDEGWDVQRIDEHPVASIILVCPECRRREAASRELPSLELKRGRHKPSQHRGTGHVPPALSLEPKRA